MGIPVDSTTGNLTGSAPQVLQFNNDLLPAQATSQLNYRVNLPSYPHTSASNPAVANSELLKPADFTALHDPTVAGTGKVIGSDSTVFLNESVGGGSVTAYDSTGVPVNVQLRWAKTANTSGGHTDTWNLFYQVDANATGTQVAWQNAGVDYKFDSAGQMSPAVTSVALTGVTVNGTSLGNVTITHGTGGVTQFADANGERSGQFARPEWLPGRLAAVGVGQRQGPRGRHLLERPDDRSRRHHARELQQPGKSQAPRRRRVPGDRRIRLGHPGRPGKIAGSRSKARIPTSPTSSAS